MSARPDVADTPCRILDAAERLLMERGYEGTSMRMIAAAAGVNLAAANYHFGSKEGLVEAVFRRRLGWLNAERLRLLDEMESRAGDKPLRPSQILEAFFGTLFDIGENDALGGMTFLRLVGRAMTEPSDFIHRFFAGEYEAVVARYKHAFGRALPEVPEDEVAWRFHFMLGAMSYAISGLDALAIVGGYDLQHEEDDTQAARHLRARLMPFLLGGLRAPLPDFPLPGLALSAAPAKKEAKT